MPSFTLGYGKGWFCVVGVEEKGDVRTKRVSVRQTLNGMRWEELLKSDRSLSGVGEKNINVRVFDASRSLNRTFSHRTSTTLMNCFRFGF